MHDGDYDVFTSGLEDILAATAAGIRDRAPPLEWGESYTFGPEPA